MAKKYTAHEMRTTADFMYADFTFARIPVQYALYLDVKTHEVADMLRQAADELEREKLYEYAVEYCDCGKWVVYKDGLTLDDARKLSSEKWGTRHRIVRREVGEWEEVK